MRNFPIKALQTDQIDTGRLQINVTSALGARPISGAKVAISYTGEPGRELEEVTTNSSAPNYWVRYKDYIKNVASSEIYATWTDAAIRANILAIMSFTLNRVYTEW